ncbi:hypothetical protein HHK36_017070 [Tetracentron sinense]|uniref:Uncharacterized protein n=1 Tax=Tetracentron sinense TaxID=13715 RepID=A0A834YYT8_TETSI|nr:hypothetical protein HHK36_017070 [Tetracentron sinense]
MFGFPLAFTTTMISWSVIEFGRLMKGELQNANESIRATNYILKGAIAGTFVCSLDVIKTRLHVYGLPQVLHSSYKGIIETMPSVQSCVI